MTHPLVLLLSVLPGPHDSFRRHEADPCPVCEESCESRALRAPWSTEGAFRGPQAAFHFESKAFPLALPSFLSFTRCACTWWAATSISSSGTAPA